MFAIVVPVACMAYFAVIAASRSLAHRGPAEGINGRSRWWRAILKSMALAVVLIGLPDVAFVMAYWCSCGGNWYVGGRRYPNLDWDAVILGTLVAVGVASLLRRALWSRGLRRSSRIVSLSLVTTILALLLAESWLSPRRSHYRDRARWHEVLAGQYGGATWAVRSSEFPLDARKAAHHQQMKERYEHAARYPWICFDSETQEP